MFVYVTLQGNESTEMDIVRYLKTLADVFSRKWTYAFDWCMGSEFFSLEHTIKVPPALVGMRHRGDVNINSQGCLSMGNAIRNEDTGFTATAESEVRHIRKRHVKGPGYREYFPNPLCACSGVAGLA